MNVLDFKKRKLEQRKISFVTCYDYPSACTVAESNVDAVLVGDSVAMTVHGHPNTLMATIEMLTLHTSAVARGLKHQFLVSDLPFLCHRISKSETIKHVQTLIRAGAKAIKIEGADQDVAETIAYLVTAGIPVMGHIGLTPQSIHQLGGNRVQGKTSDKAIHLLDQAKILEKAGCFAIVVECVPESLGGEITQALSIPVIGIGAGKDTDGQILVWHDMLGLQSEYLPRFAKQFTNGKSVLLTGLNEYVREVNDSLFPNQEYCYN